jgi:hypothetical protein
MTGVAWDTEMISERLLPYIKLDSMSLIDNSIPLFTISIQILLKAFLF